jgi:hypothetical protein
VLTAGETTNAFLAGFFDPLEPWDGAFAEAWLLLRGRHRAECFAADLRARGGVDPGLPEALEAGAAHFSSLADYWHPAGGVLFKHRRFNARPESHAAELALYWHERGLPGRWNLGTEENDESAQGPRHFGGHALEGGIAGVESDGRHGLVEMISGALHAFRRDGASWHCDTLTPVRLCAGPDVAIESWPLRARCEEGDAGIAPSPLYARRIGGALALLRRTSPPHADWVLRLTAMVMPLAQEGRMIRSWSSGDYPCMISLCGNGDTIEIAETLVHEASHQHFHALRQFGDLVEPGTDETAWSPVKECLRPIEMVLLSYHAFANVQLFFRHLARSKMVGMEFYVAHCAVLLDWRPQLESALADARSVTPTGHALWRRLSRRFDED